MTLRCDTSIGTPPLEATDNSPSRCKLFLELLRLDLDRHVAKRSCRRSPSIEVVRRLPMGLDTTMSSLIRELERSGEAGDEAKRKQR